MTPLTKILIEHISRSGPISVSEYMTQCLLHPKHGYYTTNLPLGKSGDFITAPEISQMFGEIIGSWLVQAWLDQGSPSSFVLTELGPGRGVLLRDILRVTRAVPKFHEAMNLQLVEASPTLRDLQKTALAEFEVSWIDNLSELEQLPLFLVANEFFDCLPILQFKRTAKGWQEQMIGCEDDELGFVLGAIQPDQIFPSDQDFAETSPASISVLSGIDTQISTFGGAALIIDYGDWTNAYDTLQAVKSHEKVDVLSQCGEVDLTAHVDFKALSVASKLTKVTPPTTQGLFLERLGITARAQELAKNLSGEDLENHVAAHRRLTHPDEMGDLFKVLALTPKDASDPAGFNDT